MAKARYFAITTCNADQWEKHGRTMATTFVRYWSQEIPLRVYTEGFAGDLNGGVEFVDLDQAAPWLRPWKAARTKEHRGFIPRPGKPYNFKFDAAKFAHKIAAIGAAAEQNNEVIVWLDSDIITHADVTLDWLVSLFPTFADVAWLDRERVYPECGFLMFRLPSAFGVIRRLVETYQSGEIFTFAEWHDSYVIGHVIKSAEAQGKIKVASLSGKEGRKHHHCLIHSPLSTRLDHLKGKRKELGRTSRGERLIRDDTPYWN